jgi:hypothetical protein
VHQSKYGALVINENIVRHFAARDTYAYDPDTRERRLNVTQGEAVDGKESATFSGPNWAVREGVGSTTASGSRIKVRFTGNRIDLIGVKSPDGGKAWIMLDGRPAEEVPCFLAGPIVPGANNARPQRGSARDIGPHGIELRTAEVQSCVFLGEIQRPTGAGQRKPSGSSNLAVALPLCENLVPQTWTIQVTDDEGNYKLTGSVTGADGMGHVLKPFISNSGQIGIPRELWRHGSGCVPFLHPWDGRILNRKGDTYTFNVYRSCKPIVDFQGKGGELRINLFQALPNQSHVLELITVGDGKVTVKSFDVFESPLH